MGESMDPILRAGTQVAQMDPVVLIPAMATVTETVDFAVTGSVSCLSPYTTARTISTLDHMAEGRLTWNIVTSWSKAAGKVLGKEDVVPHDERYELAEEYMDLMYRCVLLHRQSRIC
jgi:alkanesulfonate monooxygenase SsuD/methylene tetrahydromethanopterin reductase-like flavin-dependent oxidoreductase (luciferase family)